MGFPRDRPAHIALSVARERESGGKFPFYSGSRLAYSTRMSQRPPTTELWDSSAPRRSPTRFLFLVGVLLCAGLVWYFGWERLRDALHRATSIPLLLMTALIFLGFWLRAAKWRYALGPGNSAVAVFFLAKVGGNWTPGRLGEFSPLLMRRFRNAHIGAWILADRILEIMVTLFFGLVAVAGLRLISTTVAALLTFAFVASACVLVFLVLRRDLMKRLDARMPEGSRRRRAAAALAAMHDETRILGTRWPLIALVTIIAKCTDIFAVQCLCAGFGYPDVPFLLVCAARCAHALVSAAPITPDATGIPFVAAAVLLHTHGGLPYDVLTVALALEVAVINGVLWVNFAVTALDLAKR